MSVIVGRVQQLLGAVKGRRVKMNRIFVGLEVRYGGIADICKAEYKIVRCAGNTHDRLIGRCSGDCCTRSSVRWRIYDEDSPEIIVREIERRIGVVSEQRQDGCRPV